MRAVRIREIQVVRHVLDVDLHPEVGRDVIERCGIYAGVARQEGCVTVIDETVVLVGKSETESETVRYLVGVPQ